MVQRLDGCRLPALGSGGRLAALGWLAAPLLGLALGGCGAGAMGQAVMARDCGPNDTRCVLGGLDAPLAGGAVTRPAVTVRMRGSAAPSLRLVSTRPDVLEAANGVLIGKAKGVAAVLVASEDGTVLDFLHVWVNAPTRLELHGVTPDGSNLGTLGDSVDLLAGESLTVQPHAYLDAQELLGEADGTWVVEPPIAEVLHTGKPGTRRLLAKEPGQASVKITMLGLDVSLRLVVHEVPTPVVKLAPGSVVLALPPAMPPPVNTGAAPGAPGAPNGELIDPWRKKGEPGGKGPAGPPPGQGSKTEGTGKKAPGSGPGANPKDPNATKGGPTHKKDAPGKGKGSKTDAKGKGSKTDGKTKSATHKSKEADQ